MLDIRNLYERFAGGPRGNFLYHTLPAGFIALPFSAIISTIVISLPDGRILSTGTKIFVYIFIAVIFFAASAAIGFLIDLFTFPSFSSEKKAMEIKRQSEITGWETVWPKYDYTSPDPPETRTEFICKRCGRKVDWRKMWYVEGEDDLIKSDSGFQGRCECGNPYQYCIIEPWKYEEMRKRY